MVMLMIAIIGDGEGVGSRISSIASISDTRMGLIVADLMMHEKIAGVELQLFSRLTDIELSAAGAGAYITKNQKDYPRQDGCSRDSGFKKQKRFYRGRFFCKKIFAPVRT